MKLILTALLILSGLTYAIESHADAATTQPCVSQHEFASVHKRLPRNELESRWGVAHDGISIPQPDPRMYVLKYRACGYSLHVASVQVFYDVANTAIDFFRIKSVGIPAHGPT